MITVHNVTTVFFGNDPKAQRLRQIKSYQFICLTTVSKAPNHVSKLVVLFYERGQIPRDQIQRAWC